MVRTRSSARNLNSITSSELGPEIGPAVTDQRTIHNRGNIYDATISSVVETPSAMASGLLQPDSVSRWSMFSKNQDMKSRSKQKATLKRNSSEEPSSTATYADDASAARQVAAPVVSSVVQRLPLSASDSPPRPRDSAPSLRVLDPYSNAKRIPNIKNADVYAFPCSASEIEQSHHQRFPVVINMLKQNVENTPELRPFSSEIDYELRMCGSSKSEVQPSIIVFCRESIFRKLHKLLMSPHVACQYYLPSRSVLSRVFRNSVNDFDDSHLPRFKIYFWFCQQGHRILLWGRGSVDVRESRNESTSNPIFSLSGSKIKAREGERHATLGCLIQIQSRLYGLTASHPFQSIDTASSNDRTQSIPPDSPSDFINMNLIHDDIEYDLTESFDPQEIRTPFLTQQEGSLPAAASNLADAHHELGLIFPEEEVYGAQEPDLDWALVEMDKFRPALELAHSLSEARFFRLTDPDIHSHVALVHPEEHREVIVLSAEHKRGILLCGTSFLGGITRPNPVQVWTIILLDGYSLSGGDSGSLVIDASTEKIYGHVIALNPLEEAYVVPFILTLRQIQRALVHDTFSTPPSTMRSDLSSGREQIVSSDQTSGPAIYHAPDTTLLKMTEDLDWPDGSKGSTQDGGLRVAHAASFISKMVKDSEIAAFALGSGDPEPLSPRQKTKVDRPWTAAEEKKLKQLRDAGESWNKIAQAFPERTQGSIKRHWYKDMRHAEFSDDEGIALLQAIIEYDDNKWKVIGQKLGKPAKACEQYAREHFAGQMEGGLTSYLERQTSLVRGKAETGLNEDPGLVLKKAKSFESPALKKPRIGRETRDFSRSGVDL